MPNVFISYSINDHTFALKLAAELRKYEIKVWIDQGCLKIGDSLIEKIGEAIDAVDYLLVVLSQSSTASEWVKRELAVALSTEFSKRNVKVLPLLLEKCNVPPFLRDKRYADFTKIEHFDIAFDSLLHTLDLPSFKESLFDKMPGSNISAAEFISYFAYALEIEMLPLEKQLQIIDKMTEVLLKRLIVDAFSYFEQSKPERAARFENFLGSVFDTNSPPEEVFSRLHDFLRQEITGYDFFLSTLVNDLLFEMKQPI